MRRTTNVTTRIANVPNNINSIGNKRYATQEDFDAHIKQSYTRGGLGIKKIQNIFADEIGTHPTRREVEIYLQDMDVVLRKRSTKISIKQPCELIKTELAQSKEDIALSEIDRNSKDRHIKELQIHLANAEKENLRLKEALMIIRDKGRVPTDAEIENLIV